MYEVGEVLIVNVFEYEEDLIIVFIVVVDIDNVGVFWVVGNMVSFVE